MIKVEQVKKMRQEVKSREHKRKAEQVQEGDRGG